MLHVHLMSAGRIRFLEPGEKGPKTAAFRLRLEDGGELILTEGGPKKRARVGVYRPEELEAELAHLGPEAAEVTDEELAGIAQSEARRLHPLPPRPARARRHRPGVVERDPEPREARRML